MISTRKKIVVIADQLIRMKGYNAFSYADIAHKLKLKNAAIHYHFQSKSVLGMAVITATREKFIENTTLWSSESSYNQVAAFIEMYGNNSKNNCICFMGALGSAFNTLPEEMQQELIVAHEEITVWLINILRTGKMNEEINFSMTPEEMSDLITSVMLASLILDRVSKNSVLNNVKNTLLSGIEKIK